MSEWNQTALNLLATAENLMRSRGYNAFSFKDLQQEVGVKTSTIHYYFPTKMELADVVLQRFVAQHEDSLAQLAASQTSARKRLQAVASFFVQNASQGQSCLGGMLSSDRLSLSDASAATLDRFFASFETWLEQTIAEGVQQGEFAQRVQPREMAALLVAALEGGMLIARVRNTPDYYQTLLDRFIQQLSE